MDLVEFRDISTSKLPTNGEVVGYLYHLKSTKPYHTKFSACYPRIISKVCEIWTILGIPLLSYNSILKRLNKLQEKYANAKRYLQLNRVTDLLFLESLFNVAKCDCKLLTESCCCPEEEKIPESLLNFFRDQMSNRSLTLSDLHIVSDENESADTSGNSTILEPMDVSSSFREDGSASQSDTSGNSTNLDPMDAAKKSLSFCEDERIDPDYEPDGSVSPTRTIVIPNRIADLNLEAAAMEAERRHISSRAAAAIISKAFEDVGIITPEKKNLVVGPSKICRERKKAREKVMLKASRRASLECFFFDGKKDFNLRLATRSDTKVLNKSVLFENTTVVQQPGNHFLGFTSTTSGSSVIIFNAIKDMFAEKKILLTDLYAIGSDGTNTNTGWDKGIIQHFENLLHRPLHWLICVLHLNEILFKAVFVHLDGITKGPNQFSGAIGRQLEIAHTLEIVNYERISLENMPPDISIESINYEQTYIYKLAKAIDTGECSDDLAQCNVGVLQTVRWLVPASKILRVYMSSSKPSRNLKEVVNFILKVYLPSWFWIKINPSFTNGAKHVHRLLTFARKSLSSDTWTIVCEKIYNNSYFLHSENVLLAMITDDDRNIRRRAYDLIIKARQRDQGKVVQNVRVFRKPSKTDINECADHYSNVLDWDNHYYEPPFTLKLSLSELYEYKESSEIILVADIPCHSQGTEFLVQAVSKATNKVAHNDRQEAYVRVGLVARSLMPQFNTKADYRCHKPY